MLDLAYRRWGERNNFFDRLGGRQVAVFSSSLWKITSAYAEIGGALEGRMSHPEL
jgi:hypothetical protein